MKNKSIWAIFIADVDGSFPNFYPISLRFTKEEALSELNKLPHAYNYQLFELPLNEFFGYYDKNGVLKSRMGTLIHDHYHYKAEKDEKE